MDVAELARAVDGAVARNAFSGVVSVRRGGEVLCERAAGFADRSNQIANTPETRFGIASGTKFLTALAVGALIAGGRLSLDARLKEVLDLPFRSYAPEITVAHLLSHTSGVPDYYDEEKVEDFDNFSVAVPWYRLRGPRDYLAVFPDDGMKFAPGERFSYSNGGFILLALIVEELSGVRYQEFVERAVLAPAGMRRSGFFASDRLPGQTALGYVDEEGGGWRTNVFSLPAVGGGDGGAYTTAGDVAALWDAFWGGRSIPPALVEAFATPRVVVGEQGGRRTSYGYGLWLRDDARGREEYIVGRDAGVSFRSGVRRAEGLQLTLLSNTGEGVWPVLRDLEAALTPP